MKDKIMAMKHLKEHQTYPASKKNLMESCNNLMDFSDSDKKWFESHLPNGTYNSAMEVMSAIGW